jgi:hypothetical protein
VRVRMTFLPQAGKIEASWAAADNSDAHCLLPIDSILIIVPGLVAAGQSHQRKISGSSLSVEFLRFTLSRGELAQNVRACR